MILQSLLDPNKVVRVVFTTITQGIGVNLRDINSIIHYGAANSIDDYFHRAWGLICVDLGEVVGFSDTADEVSTADEVCTAMEPRSSTSTEEPLEPRTTFVSSS